MLLYVSVTSTNLNSFVLFYNTKFSVSCIQILDPGLFGGLFGLLEHRSGLLTSGLILFGDLFGYRCQITNCHSHKNNELFAIENES